MKGVKDPGGSRNTIVMSAFKVMHQKGYGAAGVTEILSGTGLTRGALYYHFPNKEALGHAVLDAIESAMKSTWLSPLEGQNDPIAALQTVLGLAYTRLTDEDVSLGCPLNNLAQELSFVDKGFRVRIAGIYRLWIDGIAEVIRKGQESRKLSRSVDPRVVAAYVVAEWTGARGLAKVTEEPSVLVSCADQLIRYLESLTDVYDMIRVINGHAESERWFAVMAVARDSHELLWRHMDRLNPIARRAVETFHIGHPGNDDVAGQNQHNPSGKRELELAGSPYRGQQ